MDHEIQKLEKGRNKHSVFTYIITMNLKWKTEILKIEIKENEPAEKELRQLGKEGKNETG